MASFIVFPFDHRPKWRLSTREKFATLAFRRESASRMSSPTLVEHARRHNLKRGEGVQHVTLDEAAVDAGRNTDLVVLDDALNALARVDPRKVQVVEMRFFGGLAWMKRRKF